MNEGTANSVDRDLAVLDLWWRHFVTCGELPPFEQGAGTIDPHCRSR